MLTGKADYNAAIPLLRRAIQLDPKFAMAYATLGTTYYNAGEKISSAEYTRRSYELRAHVSEWEKFYIESHYHHFVTGDLEKARQVYELWGQIYPRDAVPALNLGVVYQTLGAYDKSLTEFKEALRLGASESLNWAGVVFGYVHLNRLHEARTTAYEALNKNLDSADLRLALYQIAFLKNDISGMAQQDAWATDKPGKKEAMQFQEANTAAYFGRLGAAREASRRTTESAREAGDKEMEARSEAAAAIWEALYGNVAEARRHSNAALAVSKGRDTQYLATLALAIAGDAARAKNETEDLEKRYAEDTIARFNYVPTLKAQLALNQGNGVKAVEILSAAAAYELGISGSTSFVANGYSVYVRGQALLASGQGVRAASEFQKILDSPGVVVNEPIGALAHLGLGRANVTAGRAAEARGAYEKFIQLWKDADADVPVLKQAKAEYDRLR
jgi:eukaryotic-like serine/threonine-protein kinase